MNIGIVGAGVVGLTCAFNLSNKGHKVTIIEAEDYHGGLASSIKVNNTYLEKFYHHIFTSDNDLLNLVEELGLTDKMLWIEPKNAIYINKKLYPFSTPKDLLLFGEIPIISRIRMGLAVLRAKNLKDFKALENMSAKDWIIQAAGNEAYDKVWGPLLYSKFDIDAHDVSAVWIWNKFKLRGSTRSKGMNKELLGYMDGGFELIYNELLRRILLNGVDVIYKSKVDDITKNDDKVSIQLKNKTYDFDKLILTVAPNALANFNAIFPKDFVQKAGKIRYKSNICMMITTKNKVTPYYWTTIADKSLPFVLLIEHTNFVAPEKYGTNVIYLSRYIDESDGLFNATDDEIKKLFISGLVKMYPNFNEGDIIDTHIFKSKYAQPVVIQRYSEFKLPIKTPVENVYLANMASIYPEDRGQNYCVKLANQVSDLVKG